MKLGTLALIGVTALAVPPTAAVAAKVVVVRSTGPSAKAYPPGKALTDSTSIKLSNGDIVTLIGPSAAKTLRGPGVFTASAAGAGSLAAAAGRRGRFGAMRTGQVAKNPGLWDLDVSQNGKMCVARPGQVNVWRPNADAAAKLTIRGSGGRQQVVEFAPGQHSRPWPAQLPVSNGSDYQFQWADGRDPSKLSLVTVSAPPSDLPGAAQLLIEKGCENQLELLVQSAAKAK